MLKLNELLEMVIFRIKVLYKIYKKKDLFEKLKVMELYNHYSADEYISRLVDYEFKQIKNNKNGECIMSLYNYDLSLKEYAKQEENVKISNFIDSINAITKIGYGVF